MNNTKEYEINFFELSGKQTFKKSFYSMDAFMKSSSTRCPIAEWTLQDHPKLKNKTLPKEWIKMEKSGDITVDTDKLPGGNGTYYMDLKGQVTVLDGISAITTLAVKITRPFNCSDHTVTSMWPDGFNDL